MMNKGLACLPDCVEAVQRLDPIPITKELASGSYEIDANMEITVGGNSIDNCNVSKTSSLEAVTNTEGWNACGHSIDINTSEEGDVVLEDNDFQNAIIPAAQQNAIIPAEQQNAIAQHNFDNQKEDSSPMMVSLMGAEANAADVIDHSNSVLGISIPDASAELDNVTIFTQLNEPLVGCQDVQPQKEDSSPMMVSLKGAEANAADVIDHSNSVLGISIPYASAELDNVTIFTQLNEPSVECHDVQPQKEDSSPMMVSLMSAEANVADVIDHSNSVLGISIPDASAELDSASIFTQLNEPSVGCQDVQPLDVPSMEHYNLQSENGVDEATNFCQILQDGKSEHLKELHNQSEVCDDASTESPSTSQQATYNLSFPEKKSFSTSDLVWGKVKSHPWWPGQIFDFAGASKLALKYQKKDHFLIAYFGDKTFAWCEESRLKPFEPHFSQMEKQTSSDPFLRALHDILVEVSRRVELSMTCLCLPEETYADIEYQKVENAGVRGKTVNSVVDRHEIVNCFHPDKLLDYVGDLAQFPNGGTDKLELTIAQAQLKAFYLFKGYTELPSFTIGGGLVENDFNIPISTNKSLKEDELDHSATSKDLFSTKGKPRVRDGTLGKQMHIVEDGRRHKNMSDLMDEEPTFIIVNGNESSSAHDNERLLSSGIKRKPAGYFTDVERIKAKRIDLLENKETKLPSPTFSSSFKVGEFISRAASKLTCGQPLRKCYVEKSDDWTIDYLDIDDFLDFPFDNPKLQIDISEEYPPANEMLSKLCLAARNPLKGYNFSSIVISFFSALRNLQVSNFSIELNRTEKPRAKRGRKKKVIPDSELPDTSTPDHMKDSYWSDMIVPEKDAILNPPKRRGRKKRKFNGESSPSQMLNSPSDCDSKLHTGPVCPHVKHLCTAERPIIAVEEKIVDERTPTAVILYFNSSDSLPSDIDLIRIFSRYGPLKEEETSIETKTNSAMAVFKKRADAEMAFSSAAKFSTFGPALLSYRLRHFPANSSPANSLKGEDHASLIKDSKMGISESSSDGNLCEEIPPVRPEGVDRGPSYVSQTLEDACSDHVETGCAGQSSDPSVETGTVSDTPQLESLDQEMYCDLDMAECGDVSGKMQVETVGESSSTYLPENAEILEAQHAESPVRVVARTSDSPAGQFEDQMALKNTSQLEAIDHDLHTSSRAEVRGMPDKTSVSPTQPEENLCPDASPAHPGPGTLHRSSAVAMDEIEIFSSESVPDKKIVDSTQATTVSDSIRRGELEPSPESNVAEEETASG